MAELVKLWRLNIAGTWECAELPPFEAVTELRQGNAGRLMYLRAYIEWGAVDARQYDMGGHITHYVPNWPQN